MFRRFTACIAPKAYYFKDPDSGRVTNGTSVQDVAAKVRQYRMQNELEDIPYLEAVIENYLCRQKENLGGCEPLPELKRGLMETLKGGIALLKSMMYSSFASQEVADERAKICLSCPLNTFYDKTDDFAHWCNDVAEQVVGERRSKHHDELGVCSACTCGLRFKVFYNEPIKLTKKQEKEILAENPNCWQLKK